MIIQDRRVADEDWVNELARTANIRLSAEETAYCVREIDRMLAMLERMEDQAAQAEWKSGATEADELRADVPGDCLPREALLSAAPAQDGVYILVPRATGERSTES